MLVMAPQWWSFAISTCQRVSFRTWLNRPTPGIVEPPRACYQRIGRLCQSRSHSVIPMAFCMLNTGYQIPLPWRSFGHLHRNRLQVIAIERLVRQIMCHEVVTLEEGKQVLLGLARSKAGGLAGASWAE